MGVGVWDHGHVHGALPGVLAHGNFVLPPQEAHRKPSHANGASSCGLVEESESPGAGERGRIVRGLRRRDYGDRDGDRAITQEIQLEQRQGGWRADFEEILLPSTHQGHGVRLSFHITCHWNIRLSCVKWN